MIVATPSGCLVLFRVDTESQYLEKLIDITGHVERKVVNPCKFAGWTLN